MKLAETCVKYPVFTVMLIAFLVTLGVFSYRGLAVDLFPKADPATVNVEVQLPGATPEEVITGVVLPLEDAISSVSGIDEISVYSSEGMADITCTFVLERDIEGAAQDIREKVAAAIDRLPQTPQLERTRDSVLRSQAQIVRRGPQPHPAGFRRIARARLGPHADEHVVLAGCGKV